MKCGLICARSARTSASISRVPGRVELGELELAGDPAGDLVGGAHQAAGRPGRASRPGCRPRVSSTTSGLTTACRTRQPAVSQARSAAVDDRCSPCSTAPARAARRLVGVVGAERRPSASRPLVSVSATAGVPSRLRRCRRLRSALRGQALAQRGRGERGGVQRRGTWPGRPRCRVRCVRSGRSRSRLERPTRRRLGVSGSRSAACRCRCRRWAVVGSGRSAVAVVVRAAGPSPAAGVGRRTTARKHRTA